MKKLILLCAALPVFALCGCASVKPAATTETNPAAVLKNLQTKFMRQTLVGGEDSTELDDGYTELEGDYNNYAEELTAGVAMNNAAGDLVDANTRYTEIMGYTLEAMQELSADELLPDRWYVMQGEQAQLAKTQEFVTFEKDYKTKSGKIIPAHITGWLLIGEDGSVIGTGTMVQEKTVME